MRNELVILILVSLLAAGCARRPAGKDVVLDGNSMSRSISDGGKINSSAGAALAPVELQFIDTMIQLQLKAIDAEQLVATRARHIELKQQVRAIVIDQQGEIASLRQLRAAWFGDEGQAVNVDLPGVREGLQALDLQKLDLLKENEFDLEFIRELVPLFEASVAMSNDLVSRDIHPELKQLAQDIADQQRTKIEQMKKWQTEWEKP